MWQSGINNRYQILKAIGSGGIGKVFKAIDLLGRNTVAIKVLLSQEPEHVKRFTEEFLLLRKLRHPNIVKVYDFGRTDKGEPYFTMEHIDGRDIKAFLQPLDYPKFWYLILQICTTIDFLHSKRIIHGDLKPSNILISTSPDGHISLNFTDFGLAEYEKVEDWSRWKGSLPYLAPEVIRGERYTFQADLYSFGILIYEGLFRKPPFGEEDPMDLAKSHLEKEVVIPQEPPVPPGLKNLILRLLEKDPIDRFFSAKDVLHEIEKISGFTVEKSDVLLAKSLIDSTDCVGKEKALKTLRDILTQPRDKGSEFALIAGELGIGKTKLVEEFATWAQVEGFTVISTSLKESKIGEAFQDSLLRFLEPNSRASVLVLENLELVQDSFFEFLSDFIHKAQDKRILVCLTLTSDSPCPERNQRSAKIEKRIQSICDNSITSIRLDRLTETETERMLRSMFGWGEAERRITAAIHHQTGGSPSLIGQLAETLVDDGKIRREDGKWLIEPESIEKSGIPQSTKKEIEKRLTRLKPDSLELLTCASVWGSETELGVLAQLSGFPSTTVSSSLHEIMLCGLMDESQPRDKKKLRFTNNLIRRFVYARIDPEKKKVVHKKAGEILEKDTDLNKEKRMSDLANHFSQARETERAFRYSFLAAKEAEKASDHAQAITHYNHALKLSDETLFPPPPSREDIVESLAEQLDLIGELDRSLSCYREVVQMLESRASDHQRLALICRNMGRIYEKKGGHEKAVEFFEKSLQQFKTAQVVKEYATTLVDLGWTYFRKSDYQRARSLFEEAVNILRKETTSKEIGFALSALGSAHWASGDYAQANRYHHQSLKVFKETGDTKKIADCYGNLGLVARSQGDSARAIEYFLTCLDLQEKLQDHYRLSILHNNLALAYTDLSDWEHALDSLRHASRVQERTFDSVGLGYSYNNMGLIFLKRGELSQALEFFNHAITQFRAARHKSALALVYYNLGDLHANREEFLSALTYLKRSLKARKELSEEAGIADCLTLLGEVLLEQSDLHQARTYLLRAQGLYRKQGNKKAEAEVLISLAELCIKSDALPDAESHLAKSQELVQQFDNRFLEASFQRVEASFLKAVGALHNSLKRLASSALIFKNLKARLQLARTYLEIGRIKLELKRFKEAKAFLMEALSIFERERIEVRKKEVESLLEQIGDLKTYEKERISTFYQLAELLNDIWDTDELLSKSLELVIELLNAERGAIIFYSDKDKSFEVKVSKGVEPETSEDAIAISRQALKDVVKSDTPLIVEDARKDSRFAKSRSVIMYNILSILCVPLKTKSKLIGTVYLDHRGLPAVFSSGDVDFLKAFANLIATAIEKNELYVKVNEEIFQLKEVLQRTYEYPGIIGRSVKMQGVFNMVEKVASSKTAVLILGENGTGKELIAKLIHDRSQRRDAPFIKVNCAALPETLLESELFGIQEKTATGVGFRKGKFELADGGTIFLDEVGDMSLSVQAKVLRAIEEKEFERVGGQRAIKVDVRIISATNMDLDKKINEASFRKDLYFRLNTIIITIPPLRERKEDIPSLIDYFSRKLCKEHEKPPLRLGKKIVDVLKEHSWPGNVRELEHLIERAILLSDDGAFPEKLLPEGVQKVKTMVNLDRYGKLKEVLSLVEKRKILHALEKNGWNQSRAADDLGISEPTLRRRMKKYKITRTATIRSS